MMVHDVRRPYPLYPPAEEMPPALLDALLRHVGDLIVAFDRSGAVRYISPTARELFSQFGPPRTVHDFIEALHPEDGPLFRTAVRAARTWPGEAMSIEIRLAERLLDVTLEARPDHSGGLLLTARDVTELHMLRSMVHLPLFSDRGGAPSGSIGARWETVRRCGRDRDDDGTVGPLSRE